MPEKIENKPDRYYSKRERSRWDKQKRLRNIIIGFGAVVIAAALVVMGLGIYNTKVKPYSQKVIKVNDETYSMRYYINMMAMLRSYYAQYGVQDYMLPYYTTNEIEQVSLVRQEAQKLGFEADRAAAEKDIKDAGVEVTRERLDLAMASQLLEKMQSDYFRPQIEPNQPQYNAMGMLLEDQVTADSVTALLEQGGDFGDIASLNSVDQNTKYSNGLFGWTTHDALAETLTNSQVIDIIENIAPGVVSVPFYDNVTSKNVGYWLVKVLDRMGDPDSTDNPEKVYVAAMLVGSIEQAENIESRLAAGEDFAALATQLSQHADTSYKGGDMGWLAKGDAQAVEAVVNAAFELQVGQVSAPIRDANQTTTGGYWLVKVLETDDSRPLTEYEMSSLVETKVNGWMSGLSTAPGVKIEEFLTDEMSQFAISESSKITGGV